MHDGSSLVICRQQKPRSGARRQEGSGDSIQFRQAMAYLVGICERDKSGNKRKERFEREVGHEAEIPKAQKSECAV